MSTVKSSGTIVSMSELSLSSVEVSWSEEVVTTIDGSDFAKECLLVMARDFTAIEGEQSDEHCV